MAFTDFKTKFMGNLFEGLIPKDATVSVNVTLDNASLIRLGTMLIIVLAIALLLYGVVRKYS